jgi:predicted metal-binding membrane protein
VIASPDRPLIAAALIAAAALGWLWIIPMARDMYGPMTGLSAWMMTPTWDPAHLFLLWAMWAVMMAAMMLPTALPLVLLYAGGARGLVAAPRAAHAYAIAAGYLLVWSVFSVAATLLQRLLSRALILTPMMESARPATTAVFLLIAGAYQFSPLKWTCLEACRSPLSLIMKRRRPGAAGAFQIGVEHGVYCLGCCWALMLLLFAGGVMNLAVIAALTALVLVEKAAPFGTHAARLSGAVLIGWAVWLLATR